jgi:hypothetical protein
MFNAGVQVWDIRDPYNPARVNGAQMVVFDVSGLLYLSVFVLSFPQAALCWR